MDKFLKDLCGAEEVEHAQRKHLYSDFDPRFPLYFDQVHTEFRRVAECIATKSAQSSQERELQDFVTRHWERLEPAAFFALPRTDTTTGTLKMYFAEFDRLPIHREDYQRRLLARLKASLRHRDVVPAKANQLFPDCDIREDAHGLFQGTKKETVAIRFVENVLFDDGCYSGFITEQNCRCGEGIFRTKCGEKFVGHWKDDLPHGYGQKTYPDGSFFEGGWCAGKREGFGKWQQGGLTCTGYWKGDRSLAQYNVFSYSYRGLTCSYPAFALILYILWCILTRPPLLSGMQFQPHSDGFYFGSLGSQEERSGHGVFIWERNRMYSGHWLADQMHGSGVLFEETGNIYAGHFHGNLFQSGHVIQRRSTGELVLLEQPSDLAQPTIMFVSPTGDVQRGTSNSTHTSGFRLTAERTLFIGTFFNDVPVSGKMVQMAGSDVYVGGFAGSEKAGFGCSIAAGNRIFCGEWQSGRRIGPGFEIRDHDFLRIGAFDDAVLLSGKKITLRPQGGFFYGGIVNDTEEGFGVSMEASGGVYFGAWEQGEKAGAGLEVFPTGSFSTGTFRRGSLFEGKSLHVSRNAQLSFYGDIADFVAEGRGIALREDGSLYVGQWSRGGVAGLGLEVRPSFDYFFTGSYEDNRPVNGTMFSSKSLTDVFFGGIYRGERSGRGMHIWNITSAGTSAYCGHWQSGKMHGNGTLVDLGSILKAGYFSEGKFAAGLLLNLTSTHSYFGEWRNSKSGRGIFVVNNSTVHAGNWSADVMEGVGFQFSLSGEYASGMFHSGILSQGLGLVLKNEDVYFGELQKGHNHGPGIFLSKEKASGGPLTAYMGQWVSGKMQGSGVQLRLGSIIQRGQFSRGKFIEGFTFRVSENAGIYYGAMNNSLRHGKGIFVFHNETVYSGMWESDFQEGAGFMISPNGEFVRGRFRRNVMVDGTALLVLPREEVYFGGKVQGKYQGYGIYLWNDKPLSAVYMGEWQTGKMHGSGILLGLGSAVKRGMFSQGKFTNGTAFTSIEGVGLYYGDMLGTVKHGTGVLIAANRTAYWGLWENDARRGAGTLVQPTGEFWSGDFAADSLSSGSALMKVNDSDFYFGSIAKGQFHGQGTYVWRDSSQRLLKAFIGDWKSGQGASGVQLPLAPSATADDFGPRQCSHSESVLMHSEKQTANSSEGGSAKMIQSLLSVEKESGETNLAVSLKELRGEDALALSLAVCVFLSLV